jgi:ABC-type transporter Mla subunit MlaD
MDPLSIAASIAALIHVAHKITESVQAIRDAPRLIRTVANETEVLASIFSQLEKFLPAAQDDEMRQLKALLQRMKALLVELEKELDGIASESPGLLDRMKWTTREADVNQILADLLQQKASLTIMLNLCVG